jgi:hypothetical protein
MFSREIIMNACTWRRLGLCLACVVCLTPLLADAAPGAGTEKLHQFKGKVVPLADPAARAGTHLAPDAAPNGLALAGDDGKVYPLVKDSGSRLFFKDKALLNRPMRLTSRLLPGSQLLEVRAVHSYVDGQLCDVYYWCEICSIRRGEKMNCPCCGAPMELREEPVGK